MCNFLQPTRDSTGAAIAIFTARYHTPQTATHQATLQVFIVHMFLH